MVLDMKYLAREMKKKRIDMDWHQKDLAEHSGVSLDSIARYEAAMTTPSFEAVCKIADAFGCPTDDFWQRKPGHPSQD